MIRLRPEMTTPDIAGLRAKIGDAAYSIIERILKATIVRDREISGVINRMGFVYRGDVPSGNWDFTSFTTDGSWHTLDLSSIVPRGAMAVVMRMELDDDTLGTYFAIRKKGDTSSINALWATVTTANQWARADGIVPIDDDRCVEYITSNTTIGTVHAHVRGWFI